MKTQIAIGGFFLFLSLACLGHLGMLLEIGPKAWFLMFVAASAALPYGIGGGLMLWHAHKERQEYLASQNRRRSDKSMTALLRSFRFPGGA